MKIVVYFIVALIAAGSVVFGLDFASAPMPPMPASPYELRAAAPPPAPAAVTAESKSAPETEAAASAVAVKPLEAPVAPAPVVAVAPPPAPVDQQPASIAADEPGSAATTSAPRCDLDACASAYRSFTPEDCTYQPFDGPRQLCTKGKPPAAESPATAAVPATPAPEARAQACNIDACASAYRTFTAEDCTYQPSDGPRRLCTK